MKTHKCHVLRVSLVWKSFQVLPSMYHTLHHICCNVVFLYMFFFLFLDV